MASNSDLDLTLPSVVANLVGQYQGSALVLTIAFHPDTDRIGESVMFSLGRGESHWHLDRGTPLFSPEPTLESHNPARALDDLHISRNLLQLDYSNGTLSLGREAGACRCQVGGVELDSSLTLSAEQLQAGIPIFLAHRILLVIREVASDAFLKPKGDVPSALQGSGPYFSSLKRQIEIAAASDVDVLIRGETGTGKELVASAIHSNSSRAASEMIRVNMSAIPVTLAPATLFGSAKGSFTGAKGNSIGYFEQANKGVLFLDEIGDTPLEIQAQLLRVLQQREIQPVGGAIKSIDCRVIAATDAPIDEGSDFKTALRHRLAGYEIVLQPLREHPEDIGELLWFFMRSYLLESASEVALPDPQRDRREVAAWAELFHVFVCYSWPGNVRQLANFARQVSLASGNALIFPRHLRDELSADLDHGDAKQAQAPRRTSRSEDIDEQEFLDAMAKAHYEPKAAATLLGVSRTSIYRRIDETDELRIAGDIPQEEVQRALDACEGNLSKAALYLRVSRVGLRFRIRAIKQAKS